MPQKLNKAGKMQDYIPAGNGDPSGEYGTSKGTNKNFTTSDKKKTEANVITENKSVVVGDKGKKESLNKMYPNNPKSNVENGFRPDEWEEIYKFSKEINKKNDDLIDETYEIAEKYNLNNKDAIKKLKEKYSKDNKANIIDNDLTGKKEEAFSKLEKAGFKKDKNYSGGRTYEIFDKHTGNYNSISVSEDGKMFVATINRQVYTYDDLETAIDRATYKSGKAPYDKAIGWENGSYNIEKENEFRKKHIKLD